MDKTINVLFCLDDTKGDYTRHCAVTILSLLETNKNNKIKIWILSSVLSKENIDELKRIVSSYNQEIEFIIRDDFVPEELKEIMINKYSSSLAVRYRRFSPLFIKGVNRVLSLDCDVLVMKDISGIYNMDMHGKAIAAYYDIWPFRCKNKIFGIKNYINAGVLLFDFNKYDLKKITVNKMLEINEKYSQYFHGNDQDKCNIIFNEDFVIGKKGMNYQITSKFFNVGLNDAEIIHCLNKPYIEYSNIPKKLVKLYNYYLAETKWKGYPPKKSDYGIFMNLYIFIRNFCFHGVIWLMGDKLSEKLFSKIGKIFF